MSNVIINVQGMRCMHCVTSIEAALKQIGATGQANLSTNSVVILYDESKLTVEKLKETIEDQGFDVV